MAKGFRRPSIKGFSNRPFGAGPSPRKTSVGGTTNVFRKPRRKGFHGK